VNKNYRGFEPVKKEYLKSYKNCDDVIMPLRGTSKSAGYDFHLPNDVTIPAGGSYLCWSDIKAYMCGNEVLEIYPRSSIAIKKDIIIKNTVGIIDTDYYNNIKNDGNIGLFLKNIGEKEQTFKKGEAIAQAIFKSFLISDNCNSNDTRIGGVGSTSKEKFNVDPSNQLPPEVRKKIEEQIKTGDIKIPLNKE